MCLISLRSADLYRDLISFEKVKILLFDNNYQTAGKEELFGEFPEKIKESSSLVLPLLCKLRLSGIQGATFRWLTPYFRSVRFGVSCCTTRHPLVTAFHRGALPRGFVCAKPAAHGMSHFAPTLLHNFRIPGGRWGTAQDSRTAPLRLHFLSGSRYRFVHHNRPGRILQPHAAQDGSLQSGAHRKRDSSEGLPPYGGGRA